MMFVRAYQSLREAVCVTSLDLTKERLVNLKRKNVNLNLFNCTCIFLVIAIGATIWKNEKDFLPFLPAIIIFTALTWTCLCLRCYKTFEYAFLATLVALPILLVNSDKYILYAPILAVSVNFTLQLFTETQVLPVLHFVCSFILNTYYIEPVVIKFIAEKTKAEITGNFVTAVTMNSWQVYLTAIILLLLRRYNDSLINQVDDLKMDLVAANERLLQQNKELEKALETKEMFIMSFSHELKNALNGLLGNLHLMSKITIDPRTTQLLHSAYACGEILKNFVYNLLDYPNCESGDLKLSLENCSVASFFEKTWNVVKELIQNKRLTGFLKISKDVPSHLILDKQKVFQIILNLVSNAVKFTETGRVYIVVQWFENPCVSISQMSTNEQLSPINLENPDDLSSLELNEDATALRKSTLIQMVPALNQPEWRNAFYWLDLEKTRWLPDETFAKKSSISDTGTLKIMVVDNGCGIEEMEMDSIFEKRSNSNSQRAKEQGLGVGIGLWITKNLVEKLGGKIRAKSGKAVGSSFDVLLPVQAVEKASVTLPEEPSRQSLCSRGSGSFLEMLRSQRSSHVFNKDMSPHEGRGDRGTLNDLSFLKSLTKTNSLGASDTSTNSKDVVLVVDDDCFNVEYLTNCCKSIRKKFIVAYDGEEAFKLFKLRHEEICLVLTDNTMPKMTGVQLAREITNYTHANNLPNPSIFIITGDAKAIKKDQPDEKDGVSQVLMKPVEMDKVIKIILGHASHN